MNKKIISHIYKMCLQRGEEKFAIPSIRWFIYKYDLTHNEVTRTFNFFKEQNLFISEHGSKTLVAKKPFLNLFKNDTWLMFGDKIKRRVVSKKIRIANNLFEHYFEREFTLGKEVVLISVDKIYTKSKESPKIESGVDFFIKNHFVGEKIVQREIVGIDIKDFEEYKKIKHDKCMMIETKIFSKSKLLSHSFSLVPWKYFRDFKTEIMI